MVITISKDRNGFVHLKSKNPWFEKEFFGDTKIDMFDLFYLMDGIADRANNEAHEECLFEIE